MVAVSMSVPLPTLRSSRRLARGSPCRPERGGPFGPYMKRCSICLMLASLLNLSCESPSQPSPISPAPASLMITPVIDGLKLRSSERLGAVAVAGNTRRTVAAAWSSDAPDVASIGDDGMITGVKLGTTVIRASFEALSAQRPVRVVPDYGGRWTGTRHVTGCVRLSGGGPDICRFEVVNGGAVFPLAVSITHNNSSVIATLEFLVMGVTLESGRLDGSFSDTGALTLTGTISSVYPEHPAQTTLRPGDWSTVLSENGAQMTGRFIANRRFQNGWGWQEIRQDCELQLDRSQP
jgi:hypothetical protein